MARPEVPDDLVSPRTAAAQALLQEILSTAIETPPSPDRTRRATRPTAAARGSLPHRRRARVIAVIGSAAIAAGAAVVVVEVSSSGTSRGPDATVGGGPRTALVDIRRIAETSTVAVGDSGRAHVAFVLQAGTSLAQQGTNEVAWSGGDIEMKVHIEAHDGQSASDAWTKTVAGTAYSYIGPKGQPKHWVRSTDAGPASGGALFDADPRTLLSILDPAAGFSEVGTDRINGVQARHLHAAAVDRVPALNLGLEPDTANTSVTTLDLWVGADDVVQRMDLGLRRTDTKVAGGPAGQPAVGVTHDSTYSVTFFDLGVPITITAPPDAEDAGK